MPKGHMAVAGRGMAQHPHHGHLGAGGGPKISAPHHITDAEGQFIHSGGQVIGDQSIGTAQHEIPDLMAAIHAAFRSHSLLPAEGGGG